QEFEHSPPSCAALVERRHFLSKIVTRWQKMCLGVLRKINLLNARVGGLEKSRAFVFAPQFQNLNSDRVRPTNGFCRT
ncbi:MAG: hypothetical protein ABWZ38_02610, partial [Candidatus Binatia bacterium]